MGAQGSKTRGEGQAANDGQPDVQDYYELLGVDESATADEIKARALPIAKHPAR